jgi:short-subunit dehydrogenase
MKSIISNGAGGNISAPFSRSQNNPAAREDKIPAALITGASGGIGHDIARLFAADKHNVILVARSAEKLRTFADSLHKEYNIRTEILVPDLSNAKAAQSIYSEIQRMNLSVEFLINNAGFGDYGLFAQRDWDRMQQIITLNILSLTHLTRLFVEDMIERKSGRILNIASIAGFQPCPLTAVYGATKAYVISFTEALHVELLGTGVSATAFCPGPTRTGFQGRAEMNDVALFKAGSVMSSYEVAADAYRAMMRGKMTSIPGLKNRVLSFGSRLAPRFLAPRVSRFLMRRIPG